MENNAIKYIVYLTMNMVNGKYYIGVHKTDTPWVFDGYIGCGAKINTPSSYNKGKYQLHAALLKYGTSNFKRITLKVFDNPEEAYALEALLVSHDFIKQPCNYNMTVGGKVCPKTDKAVNQFSLQGEFIKTWNSETEIRNYYHSKVQLYEVIVNKRNFAGSYWTFEDVKEIDVSEYQPTSAKGFIDQYDSNGVYITSYNSVNVASQKLDIDFKKLNSAVFKQKLCEGYYFLKSGIDVNDIFCRQYKRLANKHPIYRYLESGEFDKAYLTTAAAQRDTPRTSAISLKNAVVNGCLCGGYRWSYFKSDNYFQIEDSKHYDKCPPIEQYDLEGNLIKMWDSYKDCKKEYPYCLRVCRGDLKTSAGYVFKYKY